MGHRAKHLPSQLSGGQQQRVAVARAVGGEPLILLADEPTGNLDSRSGEAVMDLLRELHQAGATICMVTHDPRYARHADRGIHLFDGRVVDEQEALAASPMRSQQATPSVHSSFSERTTGARLLHVRQAFPAPDPRLPGPRRDARSLHQTRQQRAALIVLISTFSVFA